MSERVRRIKKKSTSSWKKRVFFVVIVLIILFILWLSFFNKKTEPVEELVPSVNNQESAAIFCYTEECFLINIDGVAFRDSSKPGGNLIFLIEDKTEVEPVEIGENAIDSNTLKELLFLKKKINEEFSIRLSSAETYDKKMADYEFKTNEGWILKLSTANNANASLEILRRVLNELGSTSANLEYIDLRLPAKVFYKMK